MDRLDIGILHTSDIPIGSLDAFLDAISVEGLSVHVKSREGGTPYAALEWLIPTAVVVLIARSYFDGFLKEMGKDHYQLVKHGLRLLGSRFLGSKTPSVTIVASSGKSSQSQPYSLLFSVIAEIDSSRRFKLLIRNDRSDDEYDQALDAFLLFLYQFHNGSWDEDTIVKFAAARVVGGTLLVTFDPTTRSIEPVDPIAPHQPS